MSVHWSLLSLLRKVTLGVLLVDALTSCSRDVLGCILGRPETCRSGCRETQHSPRARARQNGSPALPGFSIFAPHPAVTLTLVANN